MVGFSPVEEGDRCDELDRCSVQGMNERVEHVQERKTEEKKGLVVTETLQGGEEGDEETSLCFVLTR